MEGGRQEGEQEDPAGQALQGRDGDRDRGGQAQRCFGGDGEERTESRVQSITANTQTEDRARGVWRQGGGSERGWRAWGAEGGSDISSKNVLNSDKPGPDNSTNIFRIVYTNALSVIGKIDLLRTYVYDLKPSVVCICEASTNSTINYAYLALDGYNLTVRADGTDTKDGWCRGLLVFVKVGVKAALRVWWSVKE